LDKGTVKREKVKGVFEANLLTSGKQIDTGTREE